MNNLRRNQIIIDCDPGQDDAVALLMALAVPESLEVLGITTVAGNVPLQLTQRNARIICELAGRKTPVFAGCDKPMKQPLVTAEEVHGVTGIDGVRIHEPAQAVQKQHAVDYIIETLTQAEPQSITLVPIGPLTNIGTAMQRAPEITEAIKEIVLMGGALREGGNVSPSAEFNVLVDPDAADIVFNCGRPIVAMGLDVTHQVLATPDRINQIQMLKNRVAEGVCAMLEYFNRFDTQKYGSEGAPLHDPCTIAYLLKPELFQLKHCNISVETQSSLTLGHTAVDFWHVTDRPRNAHWVYDVDSNGFFDLLADCLSRYAES